MTESFYFNFKLVHVGKNIENTQFLTLSIHIFPITNLESLSIIYQPPVASGIFLKIMAPLP